MVKCPVCNSKVNNDGRCWNVSCSAYSHRVVEKVEPEFITCPECDGEGQLMDVRLYPSGHTEIWEECPECWGEGEIEND